MRLWSYQLIPYLPRQQLISQWRECICIAKSIHDKGTPNHILVNKIMDYPISDFNDYCNIVLDEMNRRGYKIKYGAIKKLEGYNGFVLDVIRRYRNPFFSWHTPRYLNQCMSNLEEKFDCGGVSQEEWAKLCEGYKKITRVEWSNSEFKSLIHAHWVKDITGQLFCSECKNYGIPNRVTKRYPECGAYMKEV